MNGALMKATSRFAIAAAAGLFVGGMAMPSAKAADLGGNCCADLEERVAELEATTARKGNRKVSLVISGQVNRAVAFWDDGYKTDVYSVDSGVSRSAFQFDGSARINADVTAGYQFVWVLGLGARGHHVNQLDDDGNTAANFGTAVDAGAISADSIPAIEIANWYLDSKHWGKLTVGRINTAQTATTQTDLGGILVIGGPQMGLWNNSYYARQSGGNLAAAPSATTPLTPTGLTWNTMMGGAQVTIAGTSRADGVRYDTPTWAGFSASVAWAEDDFWDVAARYAGEFSGFRVAGTISYSQNRDAEADTSSSAATGLTSISPDIRKWQGSASILHVASGLFLDGAYLVQSYNGLTAAELYGGTVAGGNRPDTKYWYIAGGIAQNWTGLGKTVFYGEYGNIEDGATGLALTSTAGLTITGVTGGAALTGTVTSSEVNFWGLGVVQNIDAAAMELYAAYRNYSADIVVGTTDARVEDFSMVMTGARIKF
ncbi:MAG: hypothetical protein F9K29_13810 [Hyphomicrobiaceae bacterium]|nr:MAG: hypothetical protein F9K29_13810 [Hyphomicrobiaceae bacterium]